MMDKFKNNTKVKLISLLSSIVLWLYVMEVVDPEETRLFEDIPISIKNISVLNDKDLMIYPEMELTTDIYIYGKLSKLKNINRDNIHVYGEINDPIEGKNDIFLKVSTPGQVTPEFKNSNLVIVNLEKIISEEKPIEINIEGKSKVNVDEVALEDNKTQILVSGPRSLVDNVDQIIGVLDVGSSKYDTSDNIKLIPIDEYGDEVKGVTLEQQSIKVTAIMLKEKVVPIKLKFKKDGEIEVNPQDYTLSENSILVKGKKDIVDKIEYIETQEIETKDIITSKDVYLEIPKNIESDIKYVNIKLNSEKEIKEIFTYTSEEIEIRNNEENIDISSIKIPENITVNIEYLVEKEKIIKSDIVLYVDLSQEVKEDEKYEIKYETNQDFKNISIEPNKTL